MSVASAGKSVDTIHCSTHAYIASSEKELIFQDRRAKKKGD